MNRIKINKMDKQYILTKELIALLKKSFKGALTEQERVYLDMMEHSYDPDEWDGLVVDAMLELRTERLETEATEAKRASGRFVKSGYGPNKLKWRMSGGIAACVVVGVLWQLWWIYTPTYVLDDFQRCSNIAPQTELLLSPVQAQVTYRQGNSEITLQNLPGDSLQVGTLLIQWVDSGRYVVSLTERLGVDSMSVLGNQELQSVSFMTGAYQHIQVSLPDGAVVRLDAGSRLDYFRVNAAGPHRLKRREWLGLHGQALVRIPPRKDASTQLIQTVHGSLEGSEGEFVLRVTEHEVRATLLSGALLLTAHDTPDHRVMAKAGTQVLLCKVCNQQNQLENEWTVKKVNKADTAQALTWTKAVRLYRNVSMREFVSDMARWYGIQFEDIRCIPVKAKVNMTMCYRSDPAELIEFIRNSGIPVIEHKYYYSFCD